MDYKKKNLTKEITQDRETENNPPILKENLEFMSYSLPAFKIQPNDRYRIMTIVKSNPRVSIQSRHIIQQSQAYIFSESFQKQHLINAERHLLFCPVYR